jgi:hypothetical protein
MVCEKRPYNKPVASAKASKPSIDSNAATLLAAMPFRADMPVTHGRHGLRRKKKAS